MFWYVVIMLSLSKGFFYFIYDRFNFCPDNVLSCRDNQFWICYLVFFATGPSDPTALRLKHDPKSVFGVICTEKYNDDKGTFEIFYLHFEFYCVGNYLHVRGHLKQNISILMFGKPLVTFRESIFTSS